MAECSFVSNWVKGGCWIWFSLFPVPSGEGRGAGVANYSNIVVSESTFAFNVAMGGDEYTGGDTVGSTYGGGLYSYGYATIEFCTIASNRLVTLPVRGFKNPTDGGGVYTTNYNLFRIGYAGEIRGTVLAGNSPRDLTYAIHDGGANVISDLKYPSLTGSGSVEGVDPKLGPMKTVGPYIFFPLQPGSVAIDRGTNVATQPSMTDQVGFWRSLPDSGAIEWQGTNSVFWLSGAVGELMLNVQDPSYGLLLEESEDLEHWRPRMLNDYSPQPVNVTARRMFFRLRL